MAGARVTVDIGVASTVVATVAGTDLGRVLALRYGPVPVRAGTESLRPPSCFGTSVRSMCSSAVDEIDIAVMLEVDGLNDSVAAQRYGATDVHQLAQALLTAVPTAVVDNPAATDHQPIASVRLAMRGLLYAAPGLFYFALADQVRDPAAFLCLVAVAAGGWSLSQAMALVAYRVLARTDPHNTARVLRREIAMLLPLVGAVFALTAELADNDVAMVAAAQVLYVIGATVLLFHDADRLLALTLAPGVLVGTGYLLAWPVPVSAWVPVGAFALTAVAIVISACVLRNGGDGRADARATPMRHPAPGDYAAALPFAVFGLFSAGAVAYLPLWVIAAGHADRSGRLNLTVLPLILIMGYAEIELRWLQRSARAVASVSASLAGYRHGVSKAFLQAELRIAMLIAVVSAALGGVLWGLGTVNAAVITGLCAYLLLGCGLFAGLFACALDRVRDALTGFVLGAVVIAAATGALALWSPWHPAAPSGYLIACCVLFGALGLAARTVLRNPIHLV